MTNPFLCVQMSENVQKHRSEKFRMCAHYYLLSVTIFTNYRGRQNLEIVLLGIIISKI